MWENSLLAIIFGTVQGLTEFLPISSSGHLVILHEIFPFFQLSDNLGFDVALHVGTIIALISFFWRDIGLYGRAFFSSWPLIWRAFENSDSADKSVWPFSTTQRLAWLIILAILPAGLAGFFFEDIIEQQLRSTAGVAVMLILVAILFFIVEFVKKTKLVKTLPTIRWSQALFIGGAQILALIPGTSRSGITIIAGMMTNLRRDQAARFSFLISIPLIAAAGLKKTIDFIILGARWNEIPILLIGLVTAAIVGTVTIRLLLRFLEKRTLIAFGVYRIILGLVLLMMLIV